MLTFKDCLGLCTLDEDEIMEIATHEHIPALAAVEMGEALIKDEFGACRITEMIIDNIDNAVRHGTGQRAAMIDGVLGHYLAHHPEGQLHMARGY